jgi:hypothetical protein
MSERLALALAGHARSGDIGGRPAVGPDIMATLRGPGTAAPKRRPGTAGDIEEAITAIDKGLGRAWGPLHGQAGEFQ